MAFIAMGLCLGSGGGFLYPLGEKVGVGSGLLGVVFWR